MCMRCHHKSNTLCYYFILAAFIFSIFISIANFAKLKGSLNIRVLQQSAYNSKTIYKYYTSLMLFLAVHKVTIHEREILINTYLYKQRALIGVVTEDQLVWNERTELNL